MDVFVRIVWIYEVNAQRMGCDRTRTRTFMCALASSLGQIGEEFNHFFVCNLKCFSYFWSSTLIMEFWFQAWKCPFYAPLRFQTHNEIMIAVRPAAAAVIWHVYHSIKTPNTLKITFDSYSKYIEYNICTEVFFIP